MSRVPDLSDLDLQLEDVEDYTSDYPTGQADIRSSGENDVVKYRRGVIATLIFENKKLVMIAGTALVVLVAIIAMASGKGSPDVVDTTHTPLILTDAAILDSPETDDIKNDLEKMYNNHDMDPIVLTGAYGDDTPQRRALSWLSHDYEAEMDHSTRMARYALAVLYYSTNDVPTDETPEPKTWFEADAWLTKENACEWQGIECNEHLHIVEIDLSRNNLSGKVPKELTVLDEHLKTLILSENFILMYEKDYDALMSLTNLETLLMDDNFLHGSNGLPTQFGSLVSMKKLKLSYNLFKGNMDSAKSNAVLSNLNQLTHLEMEACYLTGSMPHHIGRMSNLVYLYMRRNAMKFDLEFLKTGQMTDLFALWIDANEITGTIPTEIGLLESMASLSMTNSTLTGTIPTEMGNLSTLRRLWLFNNELTGNLPVELKKLSDLEVLQVHHNKLQGEMPDGVCKNIHNSGFEDKSLTSDCGTNKISCSDECCTRCF
ncbi:MAG: hypothetical protein SGBAC_006258 [Bacillariaceae sp.]